METPLVVGVDGSDAGLTATDWAADQAVRLGVPLRIVHASRWERYEGSVPAWSLNRPSGQVRAENIAATAAERALRRAPGLKVTTDVLVEDAASALLRETRSADAVVVGSRGRGELADLLLGSVGLIVAARSHGPVIVVRGHQHARYARHQSVLLGIGEHDVAVRFAFREAVLRQAELDAVHAWRRPAAHEPAGHPLLTGSVAHHEEQRATALHDKAVEAAARAYPEVRLRRTTVEGPAHKTLVARSTAADLLVVGARRREGHFGMEPGRVAHRALHHAACPVAVVPQDHRAPTGGER
ncbi:hypothetical protein SLA_0836 [Streptomyces laurentii]|uniref:UspA domain-containing protein n=1 Tax=Streptomyces laurentii TaxID=39478 RepID=A0A160NVW7_STRLU|nr:hypothetical protein SLA_0836 [Streptomyces laurentii]